MTIVTSTDLPMPSCRGINIEESSISQLQDYLSSSAFTSFDLVTTYVTRIQQVNPRLKSVIEINPDALSIAARLDKEREDGLVRSKLHGIPFILKDNIATKDKMQTTAGSAALEGSIVSADARIVTSLRQAGAILIAKANLSEWASMRASYYAEGYSSRGGQNRNPYNLAHHAGGSSSGSASSLAANMCAFSLGTETDGSIMFPADRNSVVGIKPTVGLTSTLGVIPESPSLDTVGPFGRSVADAALVLDVIREESLSQSITASAQHFKGADGLTYASWVSPKDGLQGAKFGVPWNRVWESASTNSKVEFEYGCLMDLLERLKEAGAQIVKVDFPSANQIIPPNGADWTYADGQANSVLSEFQVVRTEFYRSLQQYLSTLEGNKNGINSLEDIVAYNVKHTDTEGGVPGTHPAWPTGQDCFDECLESKDWPETIYTQALKYIRQKSRQEGIDAALEFEGQQLDGLLVPLQADGGVACSVAAKAGYPMITIPVGVNKSCIPFGIGIIQTAFKENLLVKYGSAIEDLCKGRKLPRFLNYEADNYPYVGFPPEEVQKAVRNS